MNINSLRAFHFVMNSGSATRAAEHLHVTQPAVSRLIAALEFELDMKLFHRRNRRLEPTAEARALYVETERLLSGIDDIANIAEDIRTFKNVRLRILTHPNLGFGLLPRAMSRYNEQRPDARFSVEIRPRRNVAQWLEGHQFDLGVASLPNEHPATKIEQLGSIPGCLVVHRDDPLAAKDVIAADDLTVMDLVGPFAGTPWGYRLERFAEINGLDFRFVSTVSNGYTACQMVGMGLGATLVDLMTATAPEFRDLKPIRIEPNFSMEVGVVTLRGADPTPVVTGFADALRETVEGVFF